MGGLYSLVSRGQLFSLVVISVLVFRAKAIFKNRFFIAFFLLILLNSIQTFIFHVGGFNVRWSDFYALIYVFLFICIGYCAALSEKSWTILTFLYSIVAILLGIYSINYFTGGMSFYADMYAVSAKNQIGEVVAMGCFSAIMILGKFPQKVRLIWVAFIVVGILCMFYIRCRSAALAFLLSFVIILLKKQNRITSTTLFVSMLSVLLLLFFYDKIFDFLQQAFVGSKDIDDMDSMSTHRMDRNVDGLRFFIEHPLFGELRDVSGIAMIHNYIINRLVAYGLFSFPYLAIYFLVLFKVIKCWRNYVTLKRIGVVLTIPFIVSMFEPGAPFGPGMVFVFVYILFGHDLRLVIDNRVITIK